MFRATELFKRRGIVVVISDFYEDPQAAVDALKPLGYGGTDLIVFHLLDPAEIDFPYDDAVSFQDIETGRKMPVVPEKLRDQYRALVQEHITALSKLCGENRIDYALFNTATPLDHALFKVPGGARETEPGALMAFLAPLFLLGLGALAVPVIIHMIQRERKEVVEFPSLMFVRKIPFHSFRRQRIRHWFLLLLRCVAFILLIAAFARPFFQAPGGGGRHLRRARGGHPARPFVQHGVRGSLGPRARRGGRRDRRAGCRRPRHAHLLR